MYIFLITVYVVYLRLVYTMSPSEYPFIAEQNTSTHVPFVVLQRTLPSPRIQGCILSKRHSFCALPDAKQYEKTRQKICHCWTVVSMLLFWSWCEYLWVNCVWHCVICTVCYQSYHWLLPYCGSMKHLNRKYFEKTYEKTVAFLKPYSVCLCFISNA